MDRPFDVINVGAGGGTMARHLAPSRKKVPILARGDGLRREVENWDAAAVFKHKRYVSPDIWYDREGKPFQPRVDYFVGGATKLFGPALYRLRREDFGELRQHDGSPRPRRSTMRKWNRTNTFDSLIGWAEISAHSKCLLTASGVAVRLTRIDRGSGVLQSSHIATVPGNLGQENHEQG